jgi:hypothetical protein
VRDLRGLHCSCGGCDQARSDFAANLAQPLLRMLSAAISCFLDEHPTRVAYLRRLKANMTERPDASVVRFAENSQNEWRQQVLDLARDGQSEFTALLPAETGLPVTVYASERDDYPALIVDSQPGVHYVPSPGSLAYEIGDRIDDRTVDRWANENVEALRDYANGKFDTIEFYKRMQPVRSA